MKSYGGDIDIFKAMINTYSIVLPKVVFTIVSATVTAYGFARFEFKGKKLLFAVLMSTLFLPQVVLNVPQFVLFNKFGWIDSPIYLALIVPTLFATDTYFVFMLIQFLRGVPKELEEAAKIDGCGHLSAFVKIMLPIAKPGIVVAAVFSFVYAWGDLIYGITFITNPNMRPITSSIYNYVQQYQTLWNSTMAFGIIAIAPVVLIFIFMQKYIVSGLTNGAVKA